MEKEKRKRQPRKDSKDIKGKRVAQLEKNKSFWESFQSAAPAPEVKKPTQKQEETKQHHFCLNKTAPTPKKDTDLFVQEITGGSTRPLDFKSTKKVSSCEPVEIAPGVVLRRVYLRFPNRMTFFGLVNDNPADAGEPVNEELDGFDESSGNCEQGDAQDSASSTASAETSSEWSFSSSYSSDDDDCTDTSSTGETEEESDGGLIIEDGLETEEGMREFTQTFDPIYCGMMGVQSGVLLSTKTRPKTIAYVCAGVAPAQETTEALAPLQPYYL